MPAEPNAHEKAQGAARTDADLHVMLPRSFVLAVLVTIFVLHTVESATAQGPQQPVAPRPQSIQPRASEQPAAPFTLTPQEQQMLDRELANWEHRSQQIQTLQCEVHRFEYNRTFDTQVEGVGELRYRAPDKGLYEISRYDRESRKTAEPLDHWVCDGLSIFEFNYAAKQLIERPLPPELQGKAIANGPLPFLFGAQAADLKRRYWLRLIAPPPAYQGKLCIEAYPKSQFDAANFSRAIFVMDPQEGIPLALLLDMPNGQSQTTHVFQKVAVNKTNWLESDFAKPRTPFGWKRVVEQPEPLADVPAAPPPTQARQTVPVPERR